MSHLIIVHIGPVQDFIATARRSRDLWFGSWLLSELSKAAARSIVDQEDNLTRYFAETTNLIFGMTLIGEASNYLPYVKWVSINKLIFWLTQWKKLGLIAIYNSELCTLA